MARLKGRPSALNYEVNTDEYNSEVATIIPRLRFARSAEEVETILKEELLRCLGGMAYRRTILLASRQTFGCSGASSVRPTRTAGPAPATSLP
jgi:hypothetical protein